MKLRFVIAGVLFVAANLFAQETANVAKTPATSATVTPGTAVPVFKAGSQMVMVPVVVTGEGGKHVSGLTKEQFRVEEDGKAREISVFEEITPGKLTAASAETKHGESAAPNRASNVSQANAHSNHFTIIMLDTINTPFLKQTEGRQHLIEFLEKGLTPDEPVTLLGLGNKGVVQLHSFTTDTRVLIAALQKVNSSISSGEMASLEQQEETDQNADLMNSADYNAQQISQFMQDAIDTMAALQQRDTTRQTLDALKQVAQAFAGSRDRKTLIWASAGFPFMINDPRAFTHLGADMVPLYEQTWKALNAANIAVYPVELVGLDSRVVDASQSRQQFQPGRARHGNPMGTSGAIPYDQNYERQETLKAFADATGGRPCLNSNDFKKCYADAIEDSQSYYLLGYYLPSDAGKSGWRRLKVKVNAPDTHVRAREGFYVTPAAEDSLAVRRDELLTALLSPFEYTGVVMDVRSSSSALVEKKDGAAADSATKGAGSQKVMQDFIVHVPTSSIVIDPQNKNRLNLEIAAVALDKSGKDVSRFSQTVQVSFNPEMLARILKTGIALKEQLELIPGRYECRFIVRDNQSGQIGTVHLPFEVK